MKLRTLILALSSALLLTCACGRNRPQQEQEEAPLPRLGFYADSLSAVPGKVKVGDNFSALMTRLGMDAQAAYLLTQECDSVFDVRKLRADNTYTAYYTPDTEQLQYVVYDNDRIRQTVFKCTEPLGVWTSDKEISRELRYADVTIHSSLWDDMIAGGASPLLIIKLADIYAWTVDFFGLQQEDRFRMMYSQTLCEGDIISVDTVYYAVFSRDSVEKPAVMFDQGDGGNIYWSDKGESLRKAFLKAPLQFTRISSGFTYHRKHPVHGTVRPHTAVDYAAPIGTPVMSIGDGTVLSAGYAGGGGNTIKIRHNATYTTSYMHLSRYAKGIKAGVHVKQGQTIGYVGSTGTSTGPHLDFRVYKNGTPVNPLKLESPSEDPIRQDNLPALDSMLTVYRHMIDSLSVAQTELIKD